MRFPTNLVAALAWSLVTVQAAPSSSSRPDRRAVTIANPAIGFAHQHVKRLNFTPNAVDDYCGETTPTESFGSATPLASDCSAIAATMAAQNGVFTILPSDFANSTASSDGSGWATIAQSGSCAFAVQFQEKANVTTVLLGTNDVRFYIDSYVQDAQDGHIQVSGPIACFNGLNLVDLNWAMVHS